MLFLVWAMLPLLRRDAAGRFWGLGMLLAMIPACATLPQNRQLMFAGVGAMGLLGQFIVHVWRDRAQAYVSGRPSRTVKGLAVALVIVHGLVSPMGQCAAYLVGGAGVVPGFDQFPQMESWTDREDLIIVNHPIPDFGGFLIAGREVHGGTLPRRIRVLGPAWSAVTISRPDANRLVVRPEAGYLASFTSSLFRDREHPMSAGETVELSGMTVTVNELNARGRPAEATFDFDVPLEDTSLRWVCWEKGAFRTFVPPAIGQSVTITADGWPL